MSEAESITPDDDIRLVCETNGTGANQPEQLLYDCYVCACDIHPKDGGDSCHTVVTIITHRNKM